MIDKIVEHMHKVMKTVNCDHLDTRIAKLILQDFPGIKFVWVMSFQKMELFPVGLGLSPKIYNEIKHYPYVYVIDSKLDVISKVTHDYALHLMKKEPFRVTENPQETVENVVDFLALGIEKGLWTSSPLPYSPYDWGLWRDFFYTIGNTLMGDLIVKALSKIPSSSDDSEQLEVA